MPNICLMIGTAVPASRVMEAVGSLEGLSKWWTAQVTGSPAVGGSLEFGFPDHGPTMRVVTSNGNEIVWECEQGPEEWLGTRFHFDVSEKDNQSTLMFRHQGWSEETPFFHHCSTKWATFMLSLKSYLDTGEGRPFPNDVAILAD